MPAAGSRDRFGPFELDSGHRRLFRDGELVFVRERQMDVLIVLVKNAGETVTKETITEEAWHGALVTDNSIVQAVRGLRRKRDPWSGRRNPLLFWFSVCCLTGVSSPSRAAPARRQFAP